VEILKSLYRNARVLILDEPTAVLTPQEVSQLFDTVREMAARGTAVVFITHHLDEVMSVADRITVLRAGRTVGTTTPARTDARALARMMVGRDIVPAGAEEPARAGEPVLTLEAVSARNDRGLPGLVDVSLQVRGGQIFGVAGVAGNGQRELAEVVTGLRRPTHGRIRVGDRDLTSARAREAIDAGVAHVPEDRLGAGLVPGMTIVENAILTSYRRPPVSSGPFIDWGEARRRAQAMMAAFGVQAVSPDERVRTLSGGNLQKLLFARETAGEPGVIVAVNPSRGLDVGATEAVREALREQQRRGAAVLLISADLDEILALADPVGVLFGGRLVGVVPRERCDVEDLGLLMAGSKAGEAGAA
jgi:simple sugar transport system ATP-binding protein